MYDTEKILKLKNTVPDTMALTGRVKDWLNAFGLDYNPRLPVSCKVMAVEDSMEGENGIEDSWLFMSEGIRKAAGVALDLSKLRPKGTDNGKGLVSSGVVSFARIYSLLNEELRRGGVFRNGACVIYLDYDHPDCEDFLNAPRSLLPWAKKALYVDDDIKDSPLLPLIAKKVNDGSVWLAKKYYHPRTGERLYSQVCLELFMKSKSTCLLSHVNLGKIVNPMDIPRAFVECAQWLCFFYEQTNAKEKGYYLGINEDRQIGLGVIGLSNMLARFNVTYNSFVEDLERVLDGEVLSADNLAYNLYLAYLHAAQVGVVYNMDRMFTVAPTASCSYRHVDAQGFATSPEISPPLDREVDRDSGTFGVQTYEYHPNTEIAREVGWATQWRLLNAWQRMMNATGKAHCISSNIWSSQIVTPEWITDVFMPSHLYTTYYRINVDNQALDKSEIVTPESEACKLQSLYEEEPLTPQNDPNYCAACGG